MEMQLPKYTVEVLTDEDMDWFVNTACVSMLVHELKKPELVNIENLYTLASLGAIRETAFVAKKDGVAVGAIAGLLTPNIYNPDIKILGEMFWYVLPEHRNGRAGLMLLKAFTKCADEIADESALSLLSSSEVNHKTLARSGYHLMEYGFWRSK